LYSYTYSDTENRYKEQFVFWQQKSADFTYTSQTFVDIFLH